MKTPAIMVPCPGVVNDGLFGHDMRDSCLSCAPFWAQYPTCPTHGVKLSSALYCRQCHRFYGKPAQLDLRKYREEPR
jgi:hypothetical protein